MPGLQFFATRYEMMAPIAAMTIARIYEPIPSFAIMPIKAPKNSKPSHRQMVSAMKPPGWRPRARAFFRFTLLNSIIPNISSIVFLLLILFYLFT
ncbi:MAG TPA: hypothetical protein GXZ76_01975 [Clostridiaceae bacterium]|nr:hypothetical protein [Clostridiaceae bacterium]